jgi:hypothetical protein
LRANSEISIKWLDRAGDLALKMSVCDLAVRMAQPGDVLKAEIIRLQTQRDNIIFVLNVPDVSDEQRARLHAQLSFVQERLLLLTGESIRFIAT